MKIKSLPAIFRGFVARKYVEYPILAGCIAGYFLTKSTAVMIAPDVFIRPSIAFFYLAAVVLPYPFVLLLPFISMGMSTHPLQTFVSVFIGTQVCFFLSRAIRWKMEREVRVVAMTVATFMAQITTTCFKSITGQMPFLTYLPLGMVKAAAATIAIVVIGYLGLSILEYSGVINFGRSNEVNRLARLKGSITTILSRFKG
jgi:hypothetical protein